MIEKFSDEELEQIKRELGLYDKRVKLNNNEKHIDEIKDILGEKPFSNYVMYEGYNNIFWCIAFIVSCSMNNFSRRKYKNNKIGNWTVKQTIPIEQEEEYHKMFSEIIEIMKKHNRKWEGSDD